VTGPASTAETGDGMTAAETPGRAGPPGNGVAFVLGTTSGGTARHAGQLAVGCRRAGLQVTVLGPASARAALAAGSTEPAHSEPAHSEPAHSEPAHSEPAHSEPAHSEPAHSEPAHSEPGRTEPGHSEPGGAEPDSPEVPFQPLQISDRPHPARDARAIRRLHRLLRQAAPGVVHAHGLRAGAFAALALLPARRPRRPALIVTVHNAPPQGGRQARLLYGLLELICARRADVVLCVSADLAARMRRRGAQRVTGVAVPAPVAPPPSEQAIAAARADIDAAGRPVVLAVGRLAGQKGLDTLLAAAARWQHREPAPRLVIAGEGPLAADLAVTAGRTGVDLVLLGQRADVPPLLAAADVLVVASSWEGYPLIVEETLRAGRPLVATRVGGIPELVGAELASEAAAVLVPPGDPGALADAILNVLDNPDLGARLSAAALARAAVLPTQSDVLTAMLALYRELATT
jgi:glycosyltransferase involved in cell wall biosynthesis